MRILYVLKDTFVLCIILLFANACTQIDNEDGCEGDAGAKDGINIKYNDSAVPIKIFELDSCYLNGIFIKFWDNGKIKTYGYGKKGREYGSWMFYDTTGILLSKHEYNNGILSQVTSQFGDAVFDRKTSVLYFGGKQLNLSDDGDITNSHYTDFRLYNLSSDTIVLQTTKKQILFDKNLKVLKTIPQNYFDSLQHGL